VYEVTKLITVAISSVHACSSSSCPSKYLCCKF